MSTIKLLLKENKINNNGEIPLYIRIIKNRKTKFISLRIFLTKEQWDPTQSRVVKHKNKVRLNNLISQKVAEANKIAMEMEITNKYVSSNRIKEKIMGKTSVSFTDFASTYRDNFKKENKIGTYRKVKAVLQKLDEYTKSKNLTFGEIDVQFLKDYEKYLRDTLGNSQNTIHANIKIFRKLFNDAIREDLIEPQLNPFFKYQLKIEKTTKEYLTDDELQKIEDMSLTEGSMKFHHRNMFVFAAYAGGLRVSDVLQLKWINFSGTHIITQMQKTQDMVNVKLPGKALKIINAYKALNPDTKPDDYIFPFLENNKEYDAESLHNAISRCTAYANKDLKAIGKSLKLSKKVSFHTSRHTFATRALRKGMRIEYVSKLMGHSSIKTTQIYSKIVNSELDNAMNVFDE
jgi:integrase/recombinase XerD